ncbi:18611_t:CDS:1 [Dentiscutata erythropus]|uniref:18611_t:CDS:1 n=1 Tax=Dentiscutata erythropus TaxID=1348616 RepID=A0A9N9D2S4_9GLOM|nr:18611_t:CDS:1 [Dentiscutata erythropus]
MESAQFIVTSSLFVGAALILTFESFFRMLVVDTVNDAIKDKLWHFCLMNISALIAEFTEPMMIVALAFCSDPDNFKSDCSNWFYVARPDCGSLCLNDYYAISCYIADNIRTVFYIITKTFLIHLAYLRCKSIYSLYNSPKFKCFHVIIIGARIIELILLAVVNGFDSLKCQGAYCNPKHPECLFIPVVMNIREIIVHIFRLYYIISESIFYYHLWRMFLKTNIMNKKDKRIMKKKREIIYQIILFALDILQLTAIGIYRILRLYYKTNNYLHLETHRFADILSTGFTVFVMTRFGISMPKLVMNDD